MLDRREIDDQLGILRTATRRQSEAQHREQEAQKPAWRSSNVLAWFIASFACAIALLSLWGSTQANQRLDQEEIAQAARVAATKELNRQQTAAIDDLQAAVDEVNKDRQSRGLAPIPQPTVAAPVPVDTAKVAQLAAALVPPPPAGKPGKDAPAPVSVTALTVNASCRLVGTFSNGRLVDAGNVCGPTGPAGEAGPTGAPGVQGEKGPQGDQGPKGRSVEKTRISDTGHLMITYDDGSEEVDLGDVTGGVGPEGPKGDEGDQGPKGDVGDVGPMVSPTSVATDVRGLECWMIFSFKRSDSTDEDPKPIAPIELQVAPAVCGL